MNHGKMTATNITVTINIKVDVKTAYILLGNC